MIIIKNIKIICFFISLGLLVSCGGGSSDGEQKENLPAKPNLSLPVNGENCSTYVVVASDNTKAEISFSWAGATYATSYVLVVTQAGTQVLNKEISTTSYKVILDKGKTYSWTVTAKNKKGVNASVTNSFTTPGNPIGNYVPYAAVINFNVNATSSMASLSWVGKDEDSAATDLKYDIEIKKDNVVIQSLTNQTLTSITDFAAVLNATYQIKINTIDKQGSYSTSIVTYTYK
ncbi:hypothetical protein [Flavobacterium seoulense]|uniref:Fibronectin type-III domain-containing protein n=1 Tax=Flavobacterium seoulense TaxID=1492738 RepID=A0A066WRK2_9FLAO|nr:hypothetical protein [Flavobacterium seoulense]KDN56697.1 hypothetical protein FEM21_02000 [Flavobacterium seoulense]